MSAKEYGFSFSGSEERSKKGRDMKQDKRVENREKGEKEERDEGEKREEIEEKTETREDYIHPSILTSESLLLGLTE